MSRVFFTRRIVCLRMATSGSEDRVLKLVIWWIYEKKMVEDCYWDMAQTKRKKNSIESNNRICVSL